MQIWLIIFLMMILSNTTNSTDHSIKTELQTNPPDQFNGDDSSAANSNENKKQSPISDPATDTLGLSDLSNILVGYMTVVSLLIATSGFIYTVAPKYTSSNTRKSFRRIIYAILIPSALLIIIGIVLTLSNPKLILHIFGLIALIIPIVVTFIITRKKLNDGEQ